MAEEKQTDKIEERQTEEKQTDKIEERQTEEETSEAQPLSKSELDQVVGGGGSAPPDRHNPYTPQGQDPWEGQD